MKAMTATGKEEHVTHAMGAAYPICTARLVVRVVERVVPDSLLRATLRVLQDLAQYGQLTGHKKALTRAFPRGTAPLGIHTSLASPP